MAGALQTAFEGADAVAGFDAAFTAFAATVATGMLPAFTGTPPTAPLGVSTLLLAPQPTHAAAAATFASLIDTWMKTGSATSVPPGTVLTWS